MTSVADFVRQRGLMVSPDWTMEPWRSAQPALHWLGRAPTGESPGLSVALPADDLRAIVEAMASVLTSSSGMSSWSSHRLASALQAVAIASGGEPPEALVQAVWEATEAHQLDRPVYEFSREFGRQLLGTYRGDSRWRFDWLKAPSSGAQACFTYWTIGVKPERFTDELEADINRLTAGRGFEF